MPDIPGFWKGGPHEAILVEPHWKEFVRSIGGVVVADLLPEPRQFENADFAFIAESVIAELKEIETEFSSSLAFAKGFVELMQKLKAKEPNWHPNFDEEEIQFPSWFRPEFVRIFRPALSRILKKANRQVRETKEHFAIKVPTGVLLLVNDGFRSISPNLIRNQTSELLQHSYSSIDCCIYMTVNRYVDIGGEPKLLWLPAYSDRASDSLVTFVNTLGRQWFEYLESKIGPFTSRSVLPHAELALRGSRYIVLPDDNVDY